MSTSLIEQVYPEVRFGGYTRRDGTVQFYTRVQSLLRDDSHVLDIGCGRGKYQEDSCQIRRQLTKLRGQQRRVLGIDVDAVGNSNPLLDEFREIKNLASWPVDSASIDVAVANSVIEHVTEPDKFFSEARRVLKPGGYLCVRTYNVWNYVGIVSRLTPNRMHARITAKAQGDRHEADVFPTVYRCNTRRKLSRTMHQAGFDAYVYTLDAEPGYLQFSPMLYRLGALVHALTPPPFRWCLLGFGQAR